MKILNFFLAAMFLIFAFLQINDPDPLIWILIYGIMAVFAVMAMFEFYPRKFLIGVTIIYILYSIVYIPGVIKWLQSENKSELFDDLAKMNHLYIEESREFLGLFICIVVLAFYLIRSARLSRGAK